jgi:hypothetical protein
MSAIVDPVLQSAKALVGVSGAEFGYLALKSVVTPSLNESLTGLPEAAGPVRLLPASNELVDTVATAKVAALMTIFQTISPLTRSLGAVQTLQRLTLADMNRSKYELSGHRLRTLPAVAALHSLPYVGVDQIRGIDDVIEGAMHEAFDKNPNHESLEIIWQTALAALIRNSHNWKTISFSETTIRYAWWTCTRYLDGETMLFYAALAAYQFLLSYEQALSTPVAGRSPKTMQAVREGFAAIKHHGKYQQDFWFNRLSRLYHDRRNLHEMLPQQSEIVLALPKYMEENQQVARFFLLSRLHGHQILNKESAKYIHSPYFSESALSNPAALLAFRFNRVASSKLWSGMTQRADLKSPTGPTNPIKALQGYADQILHDVPSDEVPGVADSDDLNIALETVPFSGFDEIGAFDKVPSLNIEQLLKEIPTDLTSAIAFLCENTLPIAREFVRKFGGADSDEGIKNAAIKALQNDSGAVTKLEGAVDQLLQLKKIRYVSRHPDGQREARTAKFAPSTELVRYWSRAMRAYTKENGSPLAKRGIDFLSSQSDESIKSAFTDRLSGLFGLLGYRQQHGLENYNPLETEERFTVPIQHEILDSFVITLDEFGAFISLLRQELREHLARNGEIAGDWGRLLLDDGAMVLRTNKVAPSEATKLSPLKILKA